MSLLTLDAVRTRPAVVRVNLLPPEFEIARRARRTRRFLVAGVAAVALGCVGSGFVAHQQVATATDALVAEQGRTVALQAQQKPYAEVPAVLAQVQEARTIQADVSAYAVPWYSYLSRISAATPPGVTFTSLSLAVTPPTSASTAAGTGTAAAATTATTSTTGADPLAVSGVGILTMTGTTTSQAQVATWLEAMGGVPGIADPTLNTSVYDPTAKTLTFNATATLTDDVLLSKQ